MSRRLPPDPSEAIGTAIVKYNYQAQQPDELSLTKGTRILILEKSNDGWWRGQSGNSVGWFPSNYTTEDCDNDGEIHTYAMAENVLDIVVSILPPFPQGVNTPLNLSLPSSFFVGGALQLHVKQRSGAVVREGRSPGDCRSTRLRSGLV